MNDLSKPIPPACYSGQITLNRMVYMVVRISGDAVSHGIATIIRIAWIDEYCGGENPGFGHNPKLAAQPRCDLGSNGHLPLAG